MAEIVVQRPDGAILHFLKELPAWCVIAVYVGIFLTIWNLTGADFAPRILDGLIGTLLLSMRPRTPEPPAIKTDSMDQPTINIGSSGDILEENPTKP